MRGGEKELLRDLNRKESERLQERWISDEVFNEAAKHKVLKKQEKMM